MTLDEEKYYDNYFSTFATDGWKQLIEDLQELFDTYQIENIQDDMHLKYVQGERQILRRLLQFETGIRTAYDTIKEREAETDV